MKQSKPYIVFRHGDIRLVWTGHRYKFEQMNRTDVFGVEQWGDYESHNAAKRLAQTVGQFLEVHENHACDTEA